MPSSKQNEKNINAEQVHHTSPVNDNLLSPVKRHLIFWPIVIVGVGFDLWSKSAVHAWLETLENGQYTIIEGYINLIIAKNDGAAWSILRDHPNILLSISTLALLIVIGIFLLGKLHGKLLTIALAMFTAGIAGNLYDRAFNGGLVRDFIDVTIPVINYRWPTFNVADSLLCTAVGLIVISSFTSSSSRTPVHPQKSGC